MKRLVLAAFLFAIAGCADLDLKTRDDIRNSGGTTKKADPATKPVVVDQAPPDKGEDLNSQLRELNGRADEAENQNRLTNAAVQALKEQNAKDKAENEQKMSALEDAMKKLETQVQTLSDQVNKAKPVTASDPQAMIADGDDLANARKFKEAIVSYQKYRDAFPKGNRYAEVTFKIGGCFQELGMKEEARAFYEEVVSKHAKSPEAKKATKRLKTLK